MMTFPVFTSSGNIESISNTYLSNNATILFKYNELYAEKLFEGIEDIPYLAVDYLYACPEKDKEKFKLFLIKFYVSNGLKLINSNSIRNKDIVDMRKVDRIYSKGYPGYGQIRTLNTFYILKDLNRIVGKYKNLLVFWEKISEFKDLDLLISDIQSFSSNYPNPFIWLLRQIKELCPMQDGTVKSFSDLYTKELRHFILDIREKLNASIVSTP